VVRHSRGTRPPSPSFDTFDDEAGRDAHSNGKVRGLDGKGQGGRSVCQAPEIYSSKFWRTNFQNETSLGSAPLENRLPRRLATPIKAYMGQLNVQCPARALTQQPVPNGNLQQ